MTHDECIDDLPALLAGELDRGATQAVGRHLRDCAECRAELAEVAVAHGALAAVRRTLAPAAGAETTASELPDLPALPPLSPPPVRRRWVAGLAAAVVASLVAGGLLVTWWRPGGSTPSAGSARQASLVAVGAQAPSASGVVQMAGPAGRTDMTIRTTGLPPATAGHFYYAWLLDPATNKMLPLGVVVADSPATFEVQSDLVGRYRAVDISLQADDGNPAHSPVSVLRATYA